MIMIRWSDTDGRTYTEFFAFDDQGAAAHRYNELAHRKGCAELRIWTCSEITSLEK